MRIVNADALELKIIKVLREAQTFDMCTITSRREAICKNCEHASQAGNGFGGFINCGLFHAKLANHEYCSLFEKRREAEDE